MAYAVLTRRHSALEEGRNVLGTRWCVRRARTSTRQAAKALARNAAPEGRERSAAGLA